MEQRKVVHLLRHVEAYHNVEGDVSLHRLFCRGEWRRFTPSLLLRVWRPIWSSLWQFFFSPLFLLASHKRPGKQPEQDQLFDAGLTQTGWEQAAKIRQHIKETGLDRRVEIVVVSPMTRTLQTAAGVFGNGEYKEAEESLPPLMVGKPPHHTAISSVNCSPVVAVELCRERISKRPSDKRRPISSYKVDFPAVDFSEVKADEDILWNALVPESRKEMQARIRAFIQWLWEREENEIMVVSHSSFLRNMISHLGENRGANVVFPNGQLWTGVLSLDHSGNFVLRKRDSLTRV